MVPKDGRPPIKGVKRGRVQKEPPRVAPDSPVLKCVERLSPKSVGAEARGVFPERPVWKKEKCPTEELRVTG